MLRHFGGSVRLSNVNGRPHHNRSQNITLTHPYCDPIQPLKDGIEVGINISALFAIAFIIKLIINIINSANSQESTKD